ncbi:MAG TPA: hypothetical protein DCE41_26600, partial [Cytophagales bacterium]|nr:hypothetical protein [Cytophagales bacterium]
GTFNPNGSGPGVYAFRYVVEGVDCDNDTANFTVEVVVGPNTGLVINVAPDTVCETETATITIVSSEVGVNYTLVDTTTGTVLNTLAGTGADLDFTTPALTATTVFGFDADNGICDPVRMDEYERVVVNTNPVTSLTVTASSSIICSGESVTFTISNSEIGVDYTLRDTTNGVNLNTLPGTGGDLSFPAVVLTDTTVFGFLADRNACALVELDTNITINVTEILTFNLVTITDTTVCETDTITVSLDDSQAGITYTLYDDGVATTIDSLSMGGALTFTVPVAGFSGTSLIQVVADNGGICDSVIMNGDFDLTVLPIPDTTLDLTATNDSVCVGDNVTITIANSDPTVNYILKDLTNGVSLDTTAGVSGPLPFTISGLTATTEFGFDLDNGSCDVVSLDTTITVTVLDIDVFNLTTGRTNVCSSNNFTIDLDGSQTGVTYTVFANGIATAFTASGTGAAPFSFSVPAITFADSSRITVRATNGGVCSEETMTGFFDLIVDGDPDVTLTIQAANDTICEGDSTVITIVGSNVGVEYTLVDQTNTVILTSAFGNGGNLDFNTPALTGTTVFGFIADNGVCGTVPMNNTVEITVVRLDTFDVTTTDMIVCESDAFIVSLDNSQADVTYTIYDDGVATAFDTLSPGGALNINALAAGIETGSVIQVVATNGGICDSLVMNNSFILTVDFIPEVTLAVDASSNSICEGETVTLTIVNSEAGVDYTLVDTTNDIVYNTINSPGGNLDFTTPVVTATTVFGFYAVNGTCDSVWLNDYEQIVTNPAPDVTVGITASDDDVCVGETVNFTVVSSEVGIEYIFRDVTNGVNLDTAIGTGADLPFTTDPLVATTEFGFLVDNGLCSQLSLDTTVTVNVSQIDIQNVLTTDTTICEDGTFTVSLDNSQAGVTYTLVDSTNNVVTPYDSLSPGGPLTIDASAAGFSGASSIIVVADNGGICPVDTMNGTFVLTVLPIPDTTLSVTATSDSICVGETVDLTVVNSETGVDYILIDTTNGINLDTITGTGANLVFTTPVLSATTVFAFDADNGSCDVVRLDTLLTIHVSQIDTVTVLTTDTTLCETDSLTVELDGSQLGITYTVMDDGVATSITAIGDGNPLTLRGPLTGIADSSVISVQADNGGICPPALMDSTFVVRIDAIPDTTLNVTASAALVCEGETVDITIESSEDGVEYILKDLTNAVNLDTLIGNGGDLVFFGVGPIADTTTFGFDAINGTLCALVTLDTTITINTERQPVSGVGTDTAICDDVTLFDLDDLISGGDSLGTWSDLDGAIGLDPFTGTFNPNQTSIDVGTGAYRFTYTVFGTACGDSATTVTVTLNPTPVAGLVSDDADGIVCEGDSVTFTASPLGMDHYIFFLNGAFADSLTTEEWKVVLTDGDSVSVRVVNSSGCFSDFGLPSFQVPNITVSIASNDPDTTICVGDMVTMTATATGATTYTFYINGGLAQAGVSNSFMTNILTDGDSVYVEAFGDGGCSAISDTLIWKVNTPATAVLTSSDADNTICAGEEVVFTGAPAGLLNYDFLLNGVSIQSSTFDTLAIDTLEDGDLIRVVITDLNGCSDSSNVITNTVLPGVSLSADVTNATCNGDTDGEIDITVTGSPAPYTILWSDGNTTDLDRTGLAAGNYWVTVEDLSGCKDSIAMVVDEPAILLASVDSTQDVNCFGDATGAIYISVAGGNGDNTFVWTDAGLNVVGNSEDLENVPAGTYAVTVTDSLGCDFTLSGLTISEPTELTVAPTPVDPTACGASDGSISLVVGGGTTPYSFLWNTGATTQNLTGLGAGTYSVTITDSLGCTVDTANINLVEPGGITDVTFDKTEPLCNGESTGSLEANPSGGTAPYTYQWFDATNTLIGTDSVLSNLAAGTYRVEVTDATLCSFSASETVNEPDPFSITPAVTNLSSCGSDDGSITVTVTGGDGSYSYVWSSSTDGSFTAPDADNISSLAAGLYTVVVTDGNGCSDSLVDIQVTEPSGITLDASLVTPAGCFGEFNGAVDVSVSGGGGTLDFDWTGPNGFTSTNEDIANLEAGTYILTVTDLATGCELIESFVVTENPEIVVTPTPNNPSACGATDGSITLAVSGGTGPYSFLWSDGSTNQNLTGVGGGTYSVTVTDAATCSVDVLNIDLNEPGGITSLSFSRVDVNCHGDSTGSIDLTVIGGTAPFSYDWRNSSNQVVASTGTEDPSALPADTYTVVVTDANSCTAMGTVTILESPDIVLAETVRNVSTCGLTDGRIIVEATGGAGGFTFEWKDTNGVLPGETNDTLDNVGAGIYTVIVTDANLCQDSISNIIISEPSDVTIDSSVVSDVTCFGDSNGEIALLIANGTPPYSISWTGTSQTNDTITGLTAGDYVVTITDASGCSTFQTFTVDGPEDITVTADVVDATCGLDDGSITLTDTTGGNGGYSFFWFNADTSFSASTPNLTALAVDTYFLTMTDSLGCTNSSTISFTINNDGVIATPVDTAFQVSQDCGEVVFGWTPADPATDTVFVVDIAEDSDFTTIFGGLSDVTVTNATEFTVTGVPTDLTLFARVRVSNDCGESINSDTVALNAVASPNAPVALSSFGESCDGAVITWMSDGGGSGSTYLVDYDLDGTFASPIVENQSTTETFLNLSGLSTSTSYSFRVREINVCGDTSAYSSTFTFTTTDTSLPPTVLVASDVQCDQFTASWLPVGGASGYTIEVFDDVGLTSRIDSTTVLGTSYLVTGLTSGVEYFFHVYTENATCGQSAASTAASATTVNTIGTTTDIQIATASCSGFGLTWDAVSGAASYTVELATNAAFTDVIGTITTASESAAFSGLEADSLYFYRVAATDACGNDGAFFEDSGKTGTTTADPPTVTVTAIGCSDFTISWNAIPVDSYLVQVSTDPTFGTFVVNLSGQPGNSFTVSSGVTDGTQYFARVIGEDATCGNTAESNTVSLTTESTLAPPTLNVGVGDCTTLPISWTSVSDATGYRITYSGNGITNTLDVDAATTSTTLNGLSFGTVYQVSIATLNDCGAGTTDTESGSTSSDPTCDFDCDSFRIPGIYTTNTTCDGFENGTIGIVMGSLGRDDNEWAVIAVGDTDTVWNSFDIPDLAEATGLAAGDYTVLVRNVGGVEICMAPARTATVENNEGALSASFTTSEPGCDGFGEFTINPDGGSGTYALILTNGGSVNETLTVSGITSFDSLGAGGYDWTIADTIAGNEGCIISGSFDFLGVPALIAEAVVVDTILCAGDSLGSVQIIASGGSGNFEYSTDGSFADGNITDPVRRNLVAGFATLFVRDAENPSCVTPVPVIVEERAPIQITSVFETVQPATCDNNDGIVKIPLFTGGTQPYVNFAVDGFGYTYNSDSTILGLGRGVHVFSLEDVNGCTQEFEFTVDAPNLVIFNATADSASCIGDGGDGRIRIDSIRGNGGPYFFSLALDQPFQQIENDPFFIEGLEPGTYDIFIRSGDAETNCPNVQTVEVFGYEPVSYEFTSSDMTCHDIEDGEILLTDVRGGIGNSDDLSLFVNGSLVETNLEAREYLLRDLSQGTYTIELRRDGECASSQEEDITIGAPDRFQLNTNTQNPIITESNQPGRLPNTGKIQILDIVGGTAPYTVDLIGLDVSYREEDVDIITLNSNGYSITFEELEDSEYQLDFLDSLGCEFTLFVEVAADTLVFIPTAFSPDGNNINDNLQIGNLSFIQTTSSLDFELIVYNRWGDIIKRVPNYDNGVNVWDGTGGTDNQQLPDGVYFVTLQPMTGAAQNSEFVFKTMVEIIRER